MTLNLSSNFLGISRDFAVLSTAKRMKIDPYWQQQNCSPLNVHSAIDYVDNCWAFLGYGTRLQSEYCTIGKNDVENDDFRLYTRKYLADGKYTATVTIVHQHEISYR